MKELTIYHIPSSEDVPARIRVGYRSNMDSQPQLRETDFNFILAEDERKLIQWYLEEYLVYPWGEFRIRAKKAEELMVRVGENIFDAIFSDNETNRLYSHVFDDLGTV